MTAVEDRRPTGGPLSLADIRAAAHSILPAGIWDFIEGGSGTESTLAANKAAFTDVALVPRVLTGVATADTGARLVGTDAAVPLAIAPMAYQSLLHEKGELAAARAARTAGAPFIVSTLSSHRLEDVAATGADTWFQLYCLRDRAKNHELIGRAEDSGCRALVITVDVPLMARRPRDARNGFALPTRVRAANLDAAPGGEAHRRVPGASALAVHTSAAFAPGLSWRDLAELRDRTSLPLVVKGVLDPRDARAAVDIGAAAVVVSSHGGRQLDGAQPSMRALPAVVEAVSGDCEVLLDSGVRSGGDVLKALALGARGVLIGRPVLWGLAADGERGVGTVLALLRAELAEAMVLAGCADASAAATLRTERWESHA
ncbi:alpha-hydroxy acid oxidase [Streptomyces californicus]|uniref:alpha-hydroxy acid oxidase n=1 Tax=Streptomyces californicus TaxID=67351 RepID=UPI00296F1FBE|nr:alpha-hydroxy acid oxidase [Streptomyces californicus]MDW4901630.1 alpha-hydroxy acid oxidase [Streptomyces californicus]